jgi:hypothetical protein
MFERLAASFRYIVGDWPPQQAMNKIHNTVFVMPVVWPGDSDLSPGYQLGRTAIVTNGFTSRKLYWMYIHTVPVSRLGLTRADRNKMFSGRKIEWRPPTQKSCAQTRIILRWASFHPKDRVE